jgi:uncharacterized beta-barrel protein YwiB (DUF1934 family)
MMDVVISILGTVDDGHSVDKIEFSTVGKYTRDGSRYELSYEDGQMMGETVTSRITVDADGSAVIERSGGLNSRLNIKPGVRSQSSYQIPEGELLIGINGITVDNRLGATGGKLTLRYSIDVNAALQSKNEVVVTFEELTVARYSAAKNGTYVVKTCVMGQFTNMSDVVNNGELVVDNNSNNSKELNAYINALMDMEFIFYEFVEMVFFICRKYVLRKHLKDEQESYLDLINHLWMIVKIDWINKEECERGKYGYVYPKLHTHNKIERLEEEQKMKEEIERLKQLEVDRFVKERCQLKDEDVNCVVVEKKEDDDYSDESEFQ